MHNTLLHKDAGEQTSHTPKREFVKMDGIKADNQIVSIKIEAHTESIPRHGNGGQEGITKEKEQKWLTLSSDSEAKIWVEGFEQLEVESSGCTLWNCFIVLKLELQFTLLVTKWLQNLSQRSLHWMHLHFTINVIQARSSEFCEGSFEGSFDG